MTDPTVPEDSDPGAAPVLSMPTEDSTASVDMDSVTREEALRSVRQAETLEQVFSVIEEFGPSVGMMAIPIPGFRGAGAARFASRLTPVANSLAARASSAASRAASSSPRANAALGRAVSRARESLRKVNPRRRGTPDDATPVSPPPLNQAGRAAVRRSNQLPQTQGPPPTSVLGQIRQAAQRGSVQRSGASRHRRPLTGPRGVMGRTGASPEARGFTRTAIQAVTRVGIGGQLAIAVGEGLTASLGAQLQNNPPSDLSPDEQESRNQVINEGLRMAMNGDQEGAAQLFSQEGITDEEVARSLVQAEEEAENQNSALLDPSNQPPGRSLNQQIDSLADNADTPGMPPTVAAALEAQQSPSNAQELAQIENALAEQGLLPANEVVTGLDVGRATEPARPQLSKINEVTGQLFDMERDELVDIQHKLFASGFFGNAPYDSIKFGAKDPATFTAFQGFLEQAAQHTQRELSQGGRARQWTNLLERWTMDAGGVEGALEEAFPDPEPNFVVNLTDPEAIRSSLDDLATNVIGQGVSPKTQQRFVGMFHRQQREGQLEAQRAQHEAAQQQAEAERNRRLALNGMRDEEVSTQTQAPQVTEITQPNLEAQAESFLRTQHPNQAEAHDTVQQYDDFLAMIGAAGPRG